MLSLLTRPLTFSKYPQTRHLTSELGLVQWLRHFSNFFDRIQAAASSKLTNVKEMTSTGLQFAIEQHTRLDIDVTLHAPHVIIPYGGKYQELQNVLVVDLGQIRLYSSGQRSSIMEVCIFPEGKMNYK